MVRYKIVIEHDSDADFSWLEQDIYDPRSPRFAGPTYPTKADMDANANAYDPDWYRDPANHVALSLSVYRMTERSDDWEIVDSLHGIDFLAESKDWRTGTFYTLDALKDAPYLQDVAKDCGFKRQRTRKRVLPDDGR